MLVRLAIASTLLTIARAEETHWAYLPPVAAETPPESHLVDALLEQQRTAANIQANPLAAPHRWLERAAYTLTGLPPTTAQLKRLSANPDDATWRTLIDELLASPAYGERWARHWMDVARYADTWGYNFQKDNRYPHSYTYRDWLIRSFNNDLPYDQFIKLQIAADHLATSKEDPNLAALGFLTVGPRHGGVETIDDRVDVITRGFLSSTISCARCHDHKTDPFSQEDYYSFYSILENTTEDKPIIGEPDDETAAADFAAKRDKLLHDNHLARHAIAERLRSEASITSCLELVWLARKHDWSSGQAAAEASKRDVLRSRAVNKWRQFLDQHAWGENPSPRLARWVLDMDQAADPKAPCQQLAKEWIASLSTDDELGKLAKNPLSPLSYDAARIGEFFNQTDGNEQRDRDGALAKLEGSHPGAPHRAMALRDRDQWSPAKIFVRGNPADRGDAFDRHWPTILGGEVYPANRSARLLMAEKIADPANPLTARVMVNRIWAWHFRKPLADQGDFGPQQPAPRLQALLDTLAVQFIENGWSIKDLHRLILTSQTFRLSSEHHSHNATLDEANSLFWRWSPQRLDFESARDRTLLSAGTLHTATVGGRSVDLSSPSSNHRRSLYAFLDRYALPGLFLNFDVPHPDHHAPRRIQTTVPQQALYFLNNTLPVNQAAKLAASPDFQNLPDAPAKINWIYQHIHRRAPTNEESQELLAWINTAPPQNYAPPLQGYWQIGHRPEPHSPDAPLTPFPLFHENAWKTGPDLATAPLTYLYAAAKTGHASHSHALVLRWTAQGLGSVRVNGSIKRTQQGGAALTTEIISSDGTQLATQELAPESTITINSTDHPVKPGDSIDLILRAPNGATCAGVEWDLNILGRENPHDKEREISTLRRDFPTNNEPPAPPKAADPWADVIQALWASNEFHFIN